MRISSSQSNQENPLALQVLANFTSNKIRDSFEIWRKELSLEFNASYSANDLLIPSLLEIARESAPACEFAIVLLQPERWTENGTLALDASLQSNLDIFGRAIASAAHSEISPKIIVIHCPPSPDRRDRASTKAIDRRLEALLRPIPATEFVALEMAESMYPISYDDDFFDSVSDDYASIPYSDLGFATIGTIAIRKLWNATAPPKKAIAVDCDNTLWNGLCGESAPEALLFEKNHIALQDFLSRKSSEGWLICLCSKNDEKSVWAVFDRATEMRLRKDQIVAARINWLAKSENLASIAKELNLSLESFVFMDDDAFECESVAALFPEILAIQIEHNTNDIRETISDTWEFDARPLTDTDRKRSERYRQNAERTKLETRSMTFEDFVDSLELVTEFSPIIGDDIERAVQLGERVNQFNLNGYGLSESRLSAIANKEGSGCETLDARDRFGDYGLVGVFEYASTEETLRIEHLYLSCRALGKGIEERLSRRILDLANGRRIEFDLIDTGRNRPAVDFVSSFYGQYQC